MNIDICGMSTSSYAWRSSFIYLIEGKGHGSEMLDPHGVRPQ